VSENFSIWVVGLRRFVTLCRIAGRYSDYTQHIITTWTYHVTNAAHLVVEHFLLPDPPSGTRFQISSEIRAVPKRR